MYDGEGRPERRAGVIIKKQIQATRSTRAECVLPRPLRLPSRRVASLRRAAARGFAVALVHAPDTASDKNIEKCPFTNLLRPSFFCDTRSWAQKASGGVVSAFESVHTGRATCVTHQGGRLDGACGACLPPGAWGCVAGKRRRGCQPSTCISLSGRSPVRGREEGKGREAKGGGAGYSRGAD